MSPVSTQKSRIMSTHSLMELSIVSKYIKCDLYKFPVPYGRADREHPLIL